jgi:preprotein translocase subunit SecD
MMFAVTTAFTIVFGVFCVAMVTWAVMTVRWAIRRDRARRVSQPSDELT